MLDELFDWSAVLILFTVACIFLCLYWLRKSDKKDKKLRVSENGYFEKIVDDDLLSAPFDVGDFESSGDSDLD